MTTLLDIMPGASGHFRFESGHHSDRWLDLDALFVDAARLEPWIRDLAERVRRHDVAVVCGPLTGGAFLAQTVAAMIGAEFVFTDRVVPPSADGLYRVEYPLRPSLAAVVRGKRVAIVDDVMSAGSATRATHTSLLNAGATPVVGGALLIIGQAGRAYFEAQRLPVEAVAQTVGALWPPADCPLCAAGLPVTHPT